MCSCPLQLQVGFILNSVCLFFIFMHMYVCIICVCVCVYQNPCMFPHMYRYQRTTTQPSTLLHMPSQPAYELPTILPYLPPVPLQESLFLQKAEIIHPTFMWVLIIQTPGSQYCVINAVAPEPSLQASCRCCGQRCFILHCRNWFIKRPNKNPIKKVVCAYNQLLLGKKKQMNIVRHYNTYKT